MFESTVIFQRTQIGRDEIYEKKRGLTQSERLVLIMIDGTTPYHGVRQKLPVLTEERFQRALNTLLKKDMILEVFLPVDGQQPEEMAQTIIDRFIQQDPTDPLTIISFDPEEDFGVFGPAVPMVREDVAWPVSAEPAAEVTVMPSPVHVASVTTGVMDETLIQQVDALAEEVRAQRPHYENPIEQLRERQERRRPRGERKPTTTSIVTPAGMHWGYWLIAIGIAFIVGFAVARLVH